MTAAADRYRELFDEHHRSVLAYALRRTDATEAADVLAETMLVAWRRADDVPEGDAARPWLYGVAHRVLANRRRGEARRRRLGDRLGALLVEAAVAPTDPVGDALWVRAALLDLDPLDREVLTLTAWEGLTPSEIALALDTPAATVRTRLHRARVRLRTRLQETDREEVG